MNPYPPDPLTPEERELAQLTTRLGPHGEPSPALDAKILAAAHAAVSGKPTQVRRKPGWPVAMGLAASVVFAVGIAWQLRPMQEPTLQHSAAQDSAVLSEAPANASADASEAVAQPEAFAETESSAGQAAAAASPVIAQESAEPAAPAPASMSAPKAISAPKQDAPRSGQTLQREARAAPAEPQASPVEQQRRRGEGFMAVPPPPAPPAPQTMPAPAPVAESRPAFAPEPETRAAVAADIAADAAGNVSTAKPSAARRESSKASAPAGRAQESDTLDRVEVTGSRIRRTDLQVPVSDDAQLTVDDWLERVRTRYGLGDADAARRSLLLFVKDHPGEPVPDDLEPLLDE